jgi:nitrous oxidase accessory protein
MHGGSSEVTSSGNGIHLWQCRDIVITDNTIIGHRDGIYLEFVKHSTITGNHSDRNLRYGLHFMFSDSCRYEKNRFLANGSGVAVMYTSNVEMIQNSFADSWGGAAYGLLLKDIKNSSVTRNEFTNNSVGIHMEGSDRVDIAHNHFEANGWAIKIMANCVDNTIRSNDFIDNSFQVATNSRQSFSTFSGNYWSTYRGVDLDRDGFGDESFRPVSLYSLLVESEPSSLILVRSLLVDVLNLAERIVPTLTPESLVDASPRMRPAL